MTKEQAKKYSATRGSWGTVNPVTKIIPNKKKEKNKKSAEKHLTNGIICDIIVSENERR